MATFKTCIRLKRRDGLYTVYIRITHNREARYIKTDKVVNKSQIRKGEIKDPLILSYCSKLIKAYSDKLNKADVMNWNINDIISYLEHIDEDISFSQYARKYVFEMATVRKMVRNSKNYKLAYQSLERFAGSENIMFLRLTTQFIQSWINSLANTHRAKEMYPICVRMIYNAALDEFNDYDKNIIRIKYQPFFKIKIPVADVPEKKALDISILKKFFFGKIPESKLKSSLPELAKDVAEIVFCLAGMNTVDIFELRKNNLNNDTICYNRHKTMKFRHDKAYLEVKIPTRIQRLFGKYQSDNEYLLNFSQRYQDSNCFNINVNIGLNAYCKYNKLPHISIYSFRHSWATIAQNNCGASTEEVGFALNHASAHRVTEGYIKKDYSPISVLNEKVIACVFCNLV